MSVQIIVDSTADLRPGTENRYIVAPLTVAFADEEFLDGVTISRQEFYAKLIESDILPTTSQATPAVFESVFAQVVEAGDTAVVLTLASKLSGTYQSAVIAAADYPGEIFVVDSTSTAIGSGILAERALAFRDAGMTAEEIAGALEREKKDLRVIALLDTLEYLKKGGRISGAVAFAGGLLSIKPVIALDDGEIKILGKARGSKQGNNLLIQEMDKAGGVDFDRPLLLGYTGISDALLQKYVEDSSYIWEDRIEKLDVAVVSPVIGTHAGPGAIAVAFFKK